MSASFNRAPPRVPATLLQPGAPAFWIAVVFTGVFAGASAAALTRLLEFVEDCAWPRGGAATLLDALRRAGPWRHVLILLGAGLLTGGGQLALVRLASGNGIDTTEAIWFRAGRLPKLRTLGSAVLSVVVVGMGASLGREGAAKQAGAVFANVVSDRAVLSDEQRRLLVACGTGAGMAAAYGVPLGGALFALEVMRGMLALRMVLPAVVASWVATAVSQLFMPDGPTYAIPSYSASSVPLIAWAMLFGPIAGMVSVAYVRLVAWADRNKATGRGRLLAPVLVLTLLGVVSIAFPQVLGNGKDMTQLSFSGETRPPMLLSLLLLRPAATALCVAAGVPGGLFTPSLAVGAVLGGLLGHLWMGVSPAVPSGVFAVIGATTVLAATTQGPISSVVLMMELTGHDRSFILPVLVAVSAATLVSRTVEPRSVYDARLKDEQVEERRKMREEAPHVP